MSVGKMKSMVVAGPIAVYLARMAYAKLHPAAWSANAWQWFFGVERVEGAR